MVCDKSFIFHMCIPCGKTFSFQGKSQISRSTLGKKSTLVITFEWNIRWSIHLSYVYSCGKTFSFLLRSVSSAKSKSNARFKIKKEEKKKKTLVILWKRYLIVLSYFTHVFLVVRPFSSLTRSRLSTKVKVNYQITVSKDIQKNVLK